MRLLIFALFASACITKGTTGIATSTICTDANNDGQCDATPITLGGSSGGLWIPEPGGNEWYPPNWKLAGRDGAVIGSPGGLDGAGELGIFPTLEGQTAFDSAPVRIAGLSDREALGHATAAFDDVQSIPTVAVAAPGYADGAGSVYLLPAEAFSAGALEESHRAILGAPGEYAGATLAGLTDRGDIHLLVGAPLAADQGNRAGAVDVFFVQEGIATLLTRWLPEKEGATFGAALTTADLNADGLPDAIIGAPGEGGVGRVYAVTDGFSALRELSAEAAFTEGDVADGGFGATLAAIEGDDGYATVAVGAPFGGSGHVYIFSGGALADTGLTAGDATGTVYGQASDDAGRGLAFLDDGTLVIGAPDTKGGQGALYAFTSLRGSLSTTEPEMVRPGSRKATKLGLNLAVGDLTGDGEGDLGFVSLDSSGAATWSILPGPL